MNHEIIFLAVLVAAVVADEPLDALMELAVFLEVAPLCKTHLTQVAIKRLHLGVAPHM
jgi:hypothetical protein